MPNCPECGGNIISKMKRKICETCGLSLSPSEFDKEWSKIRDEKYNRDENSQQSRQKEYLKWYESSKD